MSRRRWFLGSIASVLLATQTISAFAFKVEGTVKLPGGAPAPDATVHLVYWDPITSEKVEKTTTSNAAGHYEFLDPVDGLGSSYFIATKAGYQGYTFKTEFGGFDDEIVDLQLGSEVPIIVAPKVSTPPTLDGVVNPQEWAGAALVYPFYKNLATTPYPVDTRGYLVWDDANLYIGIVADEPNPSTIKATEQEPDQMGIFADDRGGFYLDPTNFAAFAMGHEVWQVQSNLTNNGLIDGLLRTQPVGMSLSPQYDIEGLQVAVNRDDPNFKWSMEFKVPLAKVGNAEMGMVVTMPTEGTEWRILLTRKRGSDSMGSAITLGGYSNATQWLTLRFGAAITPPDTPGDMDGNGVVDMDDAKAALKIAAGLMDGAAAIEKGDVSGDDSAITLEDAIAIARSVAGTAPL